MPKWTAADIPDQTGRVIVITGANSGLGYESTLALARKGAHVVMASRNVQKGQVALDRVKAQVPDADLALEALDLASLDSVRDFAGRFLAAYDRLDVLMNNAGVMAIPRRQTADGFEMQMGTNHLGHFALTGLLFERLAHTSGSRIVNVTSGAHAMGRINMDDLHMTKNYSRYGAYGNSKLANVFFAFELQRRIDAAGLDIISTAAHPGYADTSLQHNSTAGSGSLLDRMVYAFGNNVLAQSAAMGALPQLYAATAPDAQKGGFYGPAIMGFRGDPSRRKPAGRANDKAAWARLWQLSEELTGVSYAALSAPGQTG